jgi:hypothetical protein
MVPAKDPASLRRVNLFASDLPLYHRESMLEIHKIAIEQHLTNL